MVKRDTRLTFRVGAFWIVGCLGVVMLSSFGVSEEALQEDSCVSETCHQGRFVEDSSSPYLHQPFAEKRCPACHVQTDVSSSSSLQSATKVFFEPRRVSCPDYAHEHTIPVQGLSPDDTYDLKVILEDPRGNRVVKNLGDLVLSEVSDVKEDDHEVPEISEVEAGPVRKGIFLETTVSWETDEVATSMIEYGLSREYSKMTPVNTVLTKHHEVTLYGLEEGQEYYLRAVSQDMFGNVGYSKDFAVSTDGKSFPPAGQKTVAEDSGSGEIAFLEAKPFLFNSILGIHVEATVPVRATVECIRLDDIQPTDQVIEGRQMTVSDNGDTHETLRNRKEWAIDACHTCHLPEDLGVSHPVGVEPSATTVVPEDLPMEAGLITCVTCHAPHSGQREYFAQKEITRKICVTCHQGY